MKNIIDIVNEYSNITEGFKINKNLNIHIEKPESKEELQKILEKRFNKNNEVLNVSNIDVTKINKLSRLFNFDYNGDKYEKYKIKKIVGLGTWDVSNAIEMSFMFSDLGGLEEIDDISDWDVSNVKLMFRMFDSCKKLKQLDLSNWNTENLINCYGMFGKCYSLESVGDISNWKLAKLDDADYMFANCKRLKLDIKKWNLKSTQNRIKAWSINTEAPKVIIK